MVDQTIVKKKVPPKPQPKVEKKKKGPSKPQPAWLFPADEENPVLNPKEKTHAEVEKAVREREKAVDYMQRRVHGVPDRLAPDPLLLTLIGVFLTDFGFNSTSRLFTNERQARQTLNGWEEALGKKIDKKTPKLEQIFRLWHRDWLIKQGDDTSSSEASSGSSSDEKSEVETEMRQDRQAISDQGSNPSSADSDVEMEDPPQIKKVKKTSKAKKVASPSPPVSSSSSDSDADDEKENVEPKAQTPLRKAKQAVAAIPTVEVMVNKLKRKAQPSLAESASDPTKVKKTKTDNAVSKPAKPTKSSKDTKSKTPPLKNVSSSSGSETSDSESDEEDTSKPQQGASLPGLPAAASDSSATINGDSQKPSTNATPSISSSSSATSSTSSSSSSDSDDAATAPPPKIATTPSAKEVKSKKHTGAKLTPLAEASRAAQLKEHPSNRYQTNSYADKAYHDLSVTRGKGFTKEKNKKKRGSYRGGTIDTSGGKSFKFDD